YHTRLYCIHSLILIRSRLPPALFPYTTLFRSIGIDGHRGALTVGHPRGGVPVVRAAGTVRPGGTTRADDAGGQVEPSGGIHTRADRKSTRLNSSHVSISYAVFCLKKKI